MITAIMSTYNEIEYLPLKIQWCRSNGIDLYVCDNMSNDGTGEMLQREGIASHQYDTQGVFSEVRMQKEIKDTLVRLQPDWVLYMGCDLFFNIPLEPIECNVISFQFLSAKYTGEVREPFTYQYGMIHQPLKFLFKWNDDIQFAGDEIIIPNEKCYHSGLIAINYGDTKPKEQRLETLARRQKAWDQGECRGWGSHLAEGSKIDYLWNRDQLVNFRNTEYWKQIEQIRHDSTT